VAFYVQEERYLEVSWMIRSEDVQEERYLEVSWMIRSEDVQEEW